MGRGPRYLIEICLFAVALVFISLIIKKHQESANSVEEPALSRLSLTQPQATEFPKASTNGQVQPKSAQPEESHAISRAGAPADVKPVNNDDPVKDSSRFLEERRKTSPTRNNINVVEFDRATIEKAHPEIGGLLKQNLPPEGANARYVDISSFFPGENHFPYEQLQTECAALQSLAAPVAIRINGNGFATDVRNLGTPSPTSSDEVLLQSISRCQFKGGPHSPFFTVAPATQPPQ